MKRHILKGLGWVALSLVVIGIAARFYHPDRYRDPIEAALSTALGRPVTIGEVTLDLFTGPGFHVTNVVIGDEPGGESGEGAEPFAYVGELRAIPRPWSLWTGHLEFSSLVLSDAHLNLARSNRPDRTLVWNFESLLRPNLLAAFPNISLRDSRINFKLDGLKSSFYLLGTDLDISPRDSAGRDWDLRLSGEPARTDRSAHGFGAIEAKGRWKQISGLNGNLELDVRLDRSELGDVVALINGHDVGLAGLISGRVHVAGPVSQLGIEGDVRVSELHGWDQSPPPGGQFNFRVSGNAGIPEQHFEIFAEPRGSPANITAHVIGKGYLQKPEWSVELRSDALPVTTLPGLFRNFGIKLPDGLGVAGTMQGEVSYQAPDGWKGHATILNAALELKNLPALHFEQAAIDMANGSLRTAPIEMTSGADVIGTVAASYSIADGAFEVDLSSAGGPLTPLLETFPVAAVPLLSTLRSGSWSGNLHYAQPAEGPGAWTGSGILTAAEARLPLLAQPLLISNARVSVDGERIQMDHVRFQTGHLQAEGEYSFLPTATRPHQFRVSVAAADLYALEALFQPALKRRSNLFDIAMSLGRSSIPDWLRALHAEGSVQIAELQLGPPGIALQRVHTHVQWDGPSIVLSDWQSRIETASLTGRVIVNLRDSAPVYSASANLSGFPWQNGSVGGIFRAQTSGVGLETLANLKLNGTFDARAFEMEPLGTVDQLSGYGQLLWSGDAPQLQLTSLKLIGGGDTWTGTGASQGSNGDVLLQLTSRGKQMTLAGSLTDPARTWTEH